MEVDGKLEERSSSEAQPGRQGRREFVKKAGKAVYIVPTLTLLASAPASAIPSDGPPPPPGSFAPAAPTPPAPNT